MIGLLLFGIWVLVGTWYYMHDIWEPSNFYNHPDIKKTIEDEGLSVDSIDEVRNFSRITSALLWPFDFLHVAYIYLMKIIHWFNKTN